MPMLVTQVTIRVPLEPGRVCVISPNRQLIIAEGCLYVGEFAGRGRRSTSSFARSPRDRATTSRSSCPAGVRTDRSASPRSRRPAASFWCRIPGRPNTVRCRAAPLRPASRISCCRLARYRPAARTRRRPRADPTAAPRAGLSPEATRGAAARVRSPRREDIVAGQQQRQKPTPTNSRDRTMGRTGRSVAAAAVFTVPACGGNAIRRAAAFSGDNPVTAPAGNARMRDARRCFASFLLMRTRHSASFHGSMSSRAKADTTLGSGPSPSPIDANRNGSNSGPRRGVSAAWVMGSAHSRRRKRRVRSGALVVSKSEATRAGARCDEDLDRRLSSVSVLPP